MYQVNIDIVVTTGTNNTPQGNYLYSDVIARITNFILGAICPNCIYPNNTDYIIVSRGQGILDVLPTGWQSDIFYRTLEYIAPSLILILYRDQVALTDPNTPKPDAILMNTDNYSITDFNTIGNIAVILETFLLANTSNQNLVDNSLYFPTTPEIKKFVSIAFGNIFIHSKNYFVWNIAEYITRIASQHYLGNYFCPIKEKIEYGHIATYSQATLNRIKNNHFNFPYRKIIFGPIMLSSDIFSIVYTNILMKKSIKMHLRKFLFRKNGPDLWAEVEADLRQLLHLFEGSPCGPYIVNVLVNDPQINTPESNQLNVEIQYANASGFSGFNIPSNNIGGGSNVPPLGRFINTLNVYLNLPSL